MDISSPARPRVLREVPPRRRSPRDAQISTTVRQSNAAISKAELYSQVAELYLAYPRRDVVKHVQRTLGMSYGTARRWIEEARNTVDPTSGETYLPAAVNGRRTPPAVKA